LPTNSIKFPTDQGFFENRTVIEIITEYDFPLVYTFYSENSDYFLAYFCDSSESRTTWLFTPTDPSRIRRLFRNSVSIRDFFKMHNGSYLCELDVQTGKIIEKATHVTFDLIPEEYLPADDVVLDRQVPEVSVNVQKKGLNPHTASERLISELVKDLRMSLRNVMLEIRDRIPDFSNTNVPESLFSFPAITPGSLELILRPTSSNPLFERSIEEISKVIAGTDTLDNDLKISIKRQLLKFSPDSKRLYNYNSIKFTGLLPTGGDQKLVSMEFSLDKDHTKLFKQEVEAMGQRETTITVSGTVEAYHPEYIVLNLSENDYGIDKLKCNFDLDKLIRNLENDPVAQKSPQAQHLSNKPGKLILHETVDVVADFAPNSRFASLRSIALKHH